MLPLMWIAIVMTAGVSIFGISFQVDYAKEVGFGPLVAASSMGVMAVINGVGRAVVGWLSDLWGRKLTLVFVIVVLGLAQFGVIWAGPILSSASVSDASRKDSASATWISRKRARMADMLSFTRPSSAPSRPPSRAAP